MNLSVKQHLQLVETLEHDLGTCLPKEYRQHLLDYNVITPDPNTFKLPNSDVRLQLFSFLGITEVVNDSIWYTKQMLGESLSENLIPIASLTNGGFVCIGIRGEETGKIYYFGDTSAIDTSETENLKNVVKIAENFEEFFDLFDEEGEIDELDENGWSLLHKAVGKGDTAEILELLGYGADIDLVTNNGYTPLFIAASEGKIEAVKILLEAGADLEIASGKSQGTPFQIACVQGNEEIVETFLQHDQSLANEVINDVTPLYIAAELGHTEVVSVLLKYNAQVNLQPTKKSATPLYIATYNGHSKIVEILLKSGADTDAAYQRATPLHIAALHGNKSIVKQLLEYGADPNKKEQEGKTPLDLAKAQGHTNIVKLLNLSKIN